MEPSITTAKFNGSIVLLGSTRLVVNTVIRMVYPFLVLFAAGMNVDISLISLALAVSMTMSAVGPFLGPVADRYGRKIGMLIGLGIFLIGTLMAGIWPGYFTFFMAMLLGNLGNNIFVPALQAYVGDQTTYDRRGFYLAILEVPWALSIMLLVPLVGILIGKTAWYTPFWYISALVAAFMIVIAWQIPEEKGELVEQLSIFKDIKKVLIYSPALLGMAMGFLIVAANEVVNVIFGVWIKDSFGLEIAALSAASAIIGISELAGEGLTMYIADRIGKERSVAIGMGLSCLFVLTLPWLGQSLTGVFIWLFLFYFTFEIILVSALPLMSEVMPQARATMMALFIAALSLGRAAGDLVGPFLYRGGFWFNAGASILLNILAVFTLSRIKISKTIDQSTAEAG
jgi:predicted MFS family arabinose efflux permease